MKKKALCQVCHDNYGDEEFCLGRCCGVPMVEISDLLWQEIRRMPKEIIAKAVATYSTKLTNG